MRRIHIVPIDDDRAHCPVGENCHCDPEVQYLDPDTGLPYENGVLVKHQSRVPADKSRWATYDEDS